MNIAAVVVTHDRPVLLMQVLTALRQQTRTVDRIIVVDNASGAETQSVLAARDDIDVVQSVQNLGGAGGFALGLAHARAAGYDWIWLLDDDAVPRPQALAELQRAIDGPACGAGAVCGAVREFGDLALTHRRHYDRWCGIERPLPRRAYGGAPLCIGSGSFVGFMVSAVAVACVGLPDARFFLAYDDTDYSLRLRRAGYAVWLAPASIVDHFRSATGRLRAGPFGARHYFNIRNRIVVAHRHAALPVLPALGASLTGLAVWLACAGRLRRGTVMILLWAIIDGYRGRLGGFPAALTGPGPADTAAPAVARSNNTP
jgi:GT2 family glycosyltransferase